MEEYLVKDGKRLRLGYTTGSCAAAAAKAAAWMLLTGRKKDTIRLQTPKGIELNLDVLNIQRSADEVRCAIRKDSGDDPDVTRGTLIFAAVRKSATPGVTIDGGEGVGRVTKPGLDQPVGAAAINSVPRKMIEENVREVCALVGYDGGLDVTISAPEGEALAKKTFNPRLLDGHVRTDDERNADLLRSRILRFNNELVRSIDHTQEDFDEILGIIDAYRTYCRTHEEYKNNKCTHAIANIERCYDDRLEKHDFL